MKKIIAFISSVRDHSIEKKNIYQIILKRCYTSNIMCWHQNIYKTNLKYQVPLITNHSFSWQIIMELMCG